MCVCIYIFLIWKLIVIETSVCWDRLTGAVRRWRDSSEGRGLPVVWTNQQLLPIITGLSGH